MRKNQEEIVSACRTFKQFEKKLIHEGFIDPRNYEKDESDYWHDQYEDLRKGRSPTCFSPNITALLR